MKYHPGRYQVRIRDRLNFFVPGADAGPAETLPENPHPV